MEAQPKARVKYIDVAKGILIMCLVYGHVSIISRMEGLSDALVDGGMWKIVPIYNSFFMPAFFILSGFCSSFDLCFKDYLWKNIKTLILPAITLCILGGYAADIILHHELSLDRLYNLASWLTTGAPWFILALFWSKLIYWPIAKLNAKIQLSIVAFIGLLGYVLHRLDIPNYQFHQHAMMLLFWLCVGNVAKDYKATIKKWLVPIGIFGIVSILIQNVCRIHFGWFIPTLDAFITIHWRDLPLHVINVVTGTTALIMIAQWLSKCQVLNVFGKGSLLIYLLDGSVRIIVINLTRQWYVSDNIWLCLSYHFAGYVMSFVIFYVLIKLIYNHRALSWIVGKW